MVPGPGPGGKTYLGLHNKTSGPEIVDFWGLSGPLDRKTHWKRWGVSPPTFSNWFAVRKGRLDPKERRSPAQKLYCVANSSLPMHECKFEVAGR